jgi:hypothetical protein
VDEIAFICYFTSNEEFNLLFLGGLLPLFFLITTGQAVAVCKKKNLLLPTKQEFEALNNCFQKANDFSDFLSRKGASDLIKKIPDMANQMFWTASVWPIFTEQAFLFLGNRGYVEETLTRGDQLSVRCVDVTTQ